MTSQTGPSDRPGTAALVRARARVNPLLAVILALLVPAAAVAESAYEKGYQSYLTGDFSAAIKQLKLAPQDDVKAQSLLAYIYEYADENELAFEIYGRLAEAGNADAQFDLGRLYQTGKGVSKDEAQALKWFTAAARQRNFHGMYALAEAYGEGKLGLQKDWVRARQWLEAAAGLGSLHAMRRLATLHRAGGWGFSVNPQFADMWDQRATEASKKPQGPEQGK